MSRRFGRNKRRAARQALSQMQDKLIDQIEIVRRLSLDLSEKKIEEERLRQALVAGSNWTARAIGVAGPFRDNVSISTLALESRK